MVDSVGQERNRDLLLAARVLPTIEKSRSVGLDPITWAREELIDFLTVSRFLHNTEGPLDVKGYRTELSNTPIYGCIEAGMASGEHASPTDYRREARQLWKDGADGIYLFNFFTFRAAGEEIPFFLLNELGDPATIGQ